MFHGGQGMHGSCLWYLEEFAVIALSCFVCFDFLCSAVVLFCFVLGFVLLLLSLQHFFLALFIPRHVVTLYPQQNRFSRSV